MICRLGPCSCVCFVAAAALPAQAAGAWSDGPFLAIPHALSVDAASLGGAPGDLRFARSDFHDALPGPWAGAPGLPDFTLAPWTTVPVDLDALSLGLDWVLATAAGVVDVPPGHWGAITLSVTRGTTGVPSGLIRGETTRPGGAAADLFAYVLPGSCCLPAPWIDVPLRAQDSGELALDAPVGTSNIDAHDVYASLLLLENPQLTWLIPGFPAVTVYFSVTTATVPMVPPAWWGPAPASGATVLATTWTAGAWTTPVPFLTPAALGITAAEDLDALAVDLLRGRVLFSTTRLPGSLLPVRDPILFAALGPGGGAHFVYRRSDGTPVSERIGLDPGGSDDIDGICALDPGPGGQPRLDRFVGTAQVPLLPSAPQRLGTALYRRFHQATGREQLRSWMTGFPPPGQALPGIAAVAVALGAPAGPYATAAVFVRPDPLSPYTGFAGHPEAWTLTLPPGTGFLGLPVFVVWGAIDGSGAALDVSPPLGIVL
jgi:hypothetical protein